MNRVQPDAMPEPAKAFERRFALARVEVVEDAARHQEVRRRDVALGLELGHAHGGVEEEVDVVPQEDVAGLRLVVEVDEAVAAARGASSIAPYASKIPAHSTITSTSLAAASARSSASTFVSATAIT